MIGKITAYIPSGIPRWFIEAENGQTLLFHSREWRGQTTPQVGQQVAFNLIKTGRGFERCINVTPMIQTVTQ